MNWILNDSLIEKNRFKEYCKKHQREVDSCFANLSKVVQLLNQGLPINGLGVSFFRSEGHSLYRIGQTGIPHAKETRLYVYAYLIGTELYVLTIGGKERQEDDIQRCYSTIEKNFKKEQDNGQSSVH